MSKKFDSAWAVQKLDYKRREAELTEYIQSYLPELTDFLPGAVIDIGCGPGDFLGLLKDTGHRLIGIDAPNGEGGMGNSYLDLCRKHRQKLGIDVREYGLKGFLGHFELHKEYRNNCVVINARGSIEQAMSHVMVGPSHSNHHNCRLLNWNKGTAPVWIDLLFDVCADLLTEDGILLIHANGTKSTDEWYSETVCASANSVGLELVLKEGELLHKWRKV